MTIARILFVGCHYSRHTSVVKSEKWKSQLYFDTFFIILPLMERKHLHLYCYSLNFFLLLTAVWWGRIKWWTMNDTQFFYSINLLYMFMYMNWKCLFVECRSYKRTWSIECSGFINLKAIESKECHWSHTSLTMVNLTNRIKMHKLKRI